MFFKNRPGQKWQVFAFNRSTLFPVAGDAANITAKISKDGGAANATNDVNPDAIEAGYYQFDLTQEETDADNLLIIPASSTTDVIVIGAPARIQTEIFGGQYTEAVVAARIPVGGAQGWPRELTIGDAYLQVTATAPKLFVKDIDGNILSALGSKTFADPDFVGKLRLAPLTDDTDELNQPPASIENTTTANMWPVLYNDDTPGTEFFWLQIPSMLTAAGVIRTSYAAQFIMNWGNDSTFEVTVNLGNIKFNRKTGQVPA